MKTDKTMKMNYMAPETELISVLANQFLCASPEVEDDPWSEPIHDPKLDF